MRPRAAEGDTGLEPPGTGVLTRQTEYARFSLAKDAGTVLGGTCLPVFMPGLSTLHSPVLGTGEIWVKNEGSYLEALPG